MTARERPDVALVGLGKSSKHALGLIERIVQEAACPVILDTVAAIGDAQPYDIQVANVDQLRAALDDALDG